MTTTTQSMKSTWPLADKSEWNFHQQLIHVLGTYPVIPGKQVPVHAKSDRMPYFSPWQNHIWIILHALVPLFIHQSWVSSTGQALHPFLVFTLYFASFNWSVVRCIKAATKLGHEYGFLDGDVHPRDGVPDVGVDKVVSALWKTTGSRIWLATHATYISTQAPADVMSDPKWWAWLWLQIGLYAIILDFWFYVYHRAMHEIDWLWKYHRTHHLTKHPNALLSAFADHEQEFFDMVGVPILTWATFRVLDIPLGYYDWWICHQYIAFTEVMGHSGLRVYATPPSTLGWLLKSLGMELVIEDHDLHHRYGYRKSHNYGKQTRVWDTLFGTCHERIEAKEQNVDWDRPVSVPIF